MFLIGFLAALPGEILSVLERQLIDKCIEWGAERTHGREWFENEVWCLQALGDLSRSRISHEMKESDSIRVVSHRNETAPTTLEQQATYFYPMYVSTMSRRIKYLVMAVDKKSDEIVVEKTTLPFRSTWTVLACYTEDYGTTVDQDYLKTALEPTFRCEKVARFLELNCEESDLFFYTDCKLQGIFDFAPKKLLENIGCYRE
jgi:hypothetical protein